MNNNRKEKVEYAINRSQRMLRDRDNSGLGDLYDAMDNMFHSYWTLPDPVKNTEWVHRVTSTDPHDAVRAGTRTLSSVMPKIKMYPLLDNQESQETANQVERALKWIFQLASRRRQVSLLRDIVLSALLYDEVIISTWHLPYQEKLMKAVKGDDKRIKAAMRYGEFLIKIENPRDTIVEYSDLMAERVLVKKVMTVQEAIDMWGAASGRKILDHLDPDKHKYVTMYDYNEIGWRTVFAYLQEDDSVNADIQLEGAIELVNQQTPYEFLPYACKIGGTSLSTVERYKRIPMLWSLYNSGQWETQNILETLLASEALAYAVSPRYAVENEFDNEVPQMDFKDPARIVNLHRGQRLADLRPPQLNEGLQALADRISGRMDKSTVPRVLQSGDFPSGAAFSSLNLATQSGMKSLIPYKELAEQSLVDMFVNILNWVHYSGGKSTMYIPKTKMVTDPASNMPQIQQSVEAITLDSSYFDVENIYLEVELTDDVPADLGQKANAAGILINQLQGSYQHGLEIAGVDDPISMMRVRMAENKQLASNQAETNKIVNQSNLEIMKLQEQLQQMIAQVQQQLQQLQAQAQAGQNGQGGPGGAPMGPGGPMGQGNQGNPVPGQPGPDGMIPPEVQAALAAQAAANGGAGANGNPNEGVFPGGPGQNPAGGGRPAIESAPGMGLREGTQQARGK